MEGTVADGRGKQATDTATDLAAAGCPLFEGEFKGIAILFFANVYEFNVFAHKQVLTNTHGNTHIGS